MTKTLNETPEDIWINGVIQRDEDLSISRGEEVTREAFEDVLQMRKDSDGRAEVDADFLLVADENKVLFFIRAIAFVSNPRKISTEVIRLK